MPWSGLPGHRGCDRGAVDQQLAIEARVGVGDQRAPVGDSPIEQRPLRREAAARQELERGVVGRDHADLRAEFDRQVAQREPAFDAERAHGRASIFDCVADPRRGTGARKQVQGQVLGGHAGWQGPFEPHAHAVRLALGQGLCRQHMGALGRADAEGQSEPRPPLVQVWLSPQTSVLPGSTMPSSGPMTCTMPWPGSPQIEEAHAGRLRAVLQGLPQRGTCSMGATVAHRQRRHRVVCRGEGQVGALDVHAALGHVSQRRRAGEVVQQVAVDVQQGPAVAQIADDVAVPDLVEQRAAAHACSLRIASHSSAPKRRKTWRTSRPGGGGATTCDSRKAARAASTASRAGTSDELQARSPCGSPCAGSRAGRKPASCRLARH